MSEERIEPGAPKKGHPGYKNKGGIYVAPVEKEAKSISNEALAERMANSDRTPATDALEKKVGKKRAKKMIDEAERAWGIPEKGFKGFIKRRLS